MSEIKAQQTLDFLAQFSEFTDEAPLTKPLPRSVSTPNALPSEANLELSRAAVLLSRKLVALLVQVPADVMRGRLVREIERLADAVITLTQTVAPNPDAETERVVLFVVGDIVRQIEAALAAPKLGKKAQAELAENLLTASVKLSPDVVV